MIGHTRWRFRSVSSTQDVAFQLAAMGAEHGTIVRADYQSAGRGRLGRTWDVPVNTALTFSLLLRPEVPLHQLGSLSIETARALCAVFTAAGASDVALKWPNDVLINGRKVSGILVQTRMMPDPVAVIGIGVNVNTPGEFLPSTATNLVHEIGQAVDADSLFDQVISAINSIWARWQPTLRQDQADQLDTLLWMKDHQVTLLDADRKITGTILGIAPDGGLRMLIDNEERTIQAGEITRGPRPSDPEVQS